jgi:hypothetical protein
MDWEKIVYIISKLPMHWEFIVTAVGMVLIVSIINNLSATNRRKMKKKELLDQPISIPMPPARNEEENEEEEEEENEE